MPQLKKNIHNFRNIGKGILWFYKNMSNEKLEDSSEIFKYRLSLQKRPIMQSIKLFGDKYRTI